MECIFRIKNNIDVPIVFHLVGLILQESHCYMFSIHPDVVKMYNDLCQHIWWCGLTRGIITFMDGCFELSASKV